MKKVFKKLYNKVMGLKFVDLDNDGKIESLRGEVTGIFSHFKKMHEQLEEVNSKLKDVISDEERVLELATKRIENAKAELQANTGLQDKVKDFIL